MSLKLYNSLVQNKVLFEPLNEREVGIYVCGPTVYDKGHLGHGRSMVAFDLIRRYLLFKGYNVKFVTNYTDIDDKMIERANLRGITVATLAEEIIQLYERDFKALNILAPTVRPLATEYIELMLQMVRKLMADDIAYEIPGDGIYFDITKHKDYGCLSKQKLSELKAGARIDVVDEKRNPQDFVLWKYEKPNEPTWSDSLGEIKAGRPGWHIECSAMTLANLGETFDIHGGGADLIFPHHECEIAQSEMFNHKQFVRYWLHNGYVRVDGEKMSKSLNNFQTLEDTFKSVDPLVVRMALITVNYRLPIDFNEELLHQAAQNLAKIRDFVVRVDNFVIKAGEDSFLDSLADYNQKLMQHLDDDLEMSKAWAVIFELIGEVNKLMLSKGLTEKEKAAILAWFSDVDRIFGCEFLALLTTDVPSEVYALLGLRQQARANSDYAESDRLREQILALGYTVLDGKDGQTLKKVLQ